MESEVLSDNIMMQPPRLYMENEVLTNNMLQPVKTLLTRSGHALMFMPEPTDEPEEEEDVANTCPISEFEGDY